METQKINTPLIDKIMTEAQEKSRPKMTEEEKTKHVYRHLANMYSTYLQCGGHGKAAANKSQFEALKAEMESIGLEIPNKKMLSMYGDFNGVGSY